MVLLLVFADAQGTIITLNLLQFNSPESQILVAVEKFTVDQKLEHRFLFILQISKVKDDLFLIIFFYDGNHVLAISEIAAVKIFYEELIAI